MILMLIVALEKIDGRFMTQIIFKLVGWKKEVVKSEGNITKDGKIGYELADGQVSVQMMQTNFWIIWELATPKFF